MGPRVFSPEACSLTEDSIVELRVLVRGGSQVLSDTMVETAGLLGMKS
jgi:hypothetical protein